MSVRLFRKAVSQNINSAHRFSKEKLGLGSLPDFYIIGAQKSGTSSLYDYICQHPGIIHRLKKEIHFFNKPLNKSKGLAFYKSHFSSYSQRKKLSQQLGYFPLEGEATPFSVHPWVPQWVFEVTPRASLIFIVRNPVDRAFSHYRHNQRSGRETLSFEDAIAHEKARTDSDLQTLMDNPDHWPKDFLSFSYLRRGLYQEQLERWLKYFPMEQIKVVSFEDFVVDQHQIGSQIFNFLQLPEVALTKTFRSNAGTAGADKCRKEPMSAEIRQQLSDYFKVHNQSFFSAIKKNLGWSV